MALTRTWRSAAIGLLIGGSFPVAGVSRVAAQAIQPPSTPPSPSPNPTPAAPLPTALSPATDSAAIAEAATGSEAQLEERVRQLEAMVSRLATQVEAGARSGAPSAGGGATPPARGANETPATGGAPRTTQSTNPNATYRNATGPLAPGQGTPMVPAPSDKDNMPAKAFNFPIKGRFGPGFEWRSEDDEYVLQFHNLTQIDSRTYGQGGQQPVKDTFAIPRQWFMFSGRLGKPYEYFVSFQNAFDAILALDIFMNIHWDDRLQFKFGRYKTPFTYEFYQLPIQGLIQPERSLFFNNFGLNREIGFTTWGQLFDKKVDYAVSILNGARNGFLDLNDAKNVTGLVTYRPFLEHEDSFFQYLNIGGSVLAGNVVNPVSPLTLRTAVATAGNAIVGVPFFTFNNNVREAGTREFWTAHAALYRNQLSLISEWQGGSQQYALASNIQARTRVPVESFYVQSGYFLTGETVTGRNVVNPIKNFDLRPGYRGPGAVELTARYNYLTLGQQVFTAGLSDPNQSSRSLYTTDVGVNWYWTQNIKWMLDWQHAEFGNPVIFAPGRSQKTSDLYLLRMQIYF